MRCFHLIDILNRWALSGNLEAKESGEGGLLPGL